MKPAGWHEWFAWYPVKLMSGEKVWLKTVERLFVRFNLADGYCYKTRYRKNRQRLRPLKVGKVSYA